MSDSHGAMHRGDNRMGDDRSKRGWEREGKREEDEGRRCQKEASNGRDGERGIGHNSKATRDGRIDTCMYELRT